ncbi:MAG: DUF1080 domain-containing protein [bacterium]|nr:DUF1080 domain-containing protein [bacterium]
MPAELATLSATPAEGSPAAIRWSVGKTALQNGDLAEARRHFRAALELHPCSTEVLLDLLHATADDPDLQELWIHRLVRAAINDRGRLGLSGAQKKLLPKGIELGPALDLVKKRSAAIAEVARFAQKQRATGSKNAPRAQLLGFASELLLALADGTPAPLAAVADKVRRLQVALPPDYDRVFNGLLAVMRRQPAAGDDPAIVKERAIRAARILVGLARQATFKDLQGPPPPDMTSIGQRAREFFSGSDRDAQGEAKVWTIAELEAMDDKTRTEFTDAHDTWQHPGVAVSLTGKYRVETTCGHDTLLGVAKSVELHHARLANHYGKDPFGQRQGIVRIVPEDSDLETEGAPYWWAGGFQSGDRTTIRFAWSTIPALGRTLTHELTHRFDGVVAPFLNAWYKEGHAVWTGGHYAKMTDTEFVENHLRKGAVDFTWREDYGRRKKFEKLLKGTIEEYRDNYKAGYALYAYLRTFPPTGKPLFGDALARFEKNSRASRKNPVGYFEKTFCDGKDGRPADLEGFLEGWQGFLRGVGRWLVRERNKDNKWVEAYGKVGPGESMKKVLDRPTWSWARTRAEPFFGQDHAAAATRLLSEVGDHEGTVAACIWSLAVDGWRPDTTLAAVVSTQQLPSQNAAQAFTALARTRFPGVGKPPATPLPGQLARTTQFIKSLGDRADVLRAAGHVKAAAALAAEHDELARLLDLPARAGATPAPTKTAGAPTPPPPAVPTYLGGHGWTESSLTTFDDRRKTGLWYVEPNGDVHVGREKPREGTGSVDRRAHQRDAFVHTVAWLSPGVYVLRGRVHFTTSYVRGALIFGHSRRDRGLRLRFTSGDFEYAVGRRATNQRFGRVSMRFEGLWERDGNMPRMNPARRVEVSDDGAWFDYEITVRGPRVEIRLNDEEPILYSVHDGAPIEGHVGFAMGMGSIRVQQPTVQRLDHQEHGRMVGLDLAGTPSAKLAELLSLPTRGFPVSPDGTLVLWIPKNAEDIAEVIMPRAIPTLARLLNRPHEHPQSWVLAVPKDMSAQDRKDVQRQVADVRGQPLPIIEHDIGRPFRGRYPFVLFLDGLGVLRAAADVADTKFHTQVSRWARKFRAR